MDRALPIALGALSVSSGLALMTLDILLSISLSKESSTSDLKLVGIVASSLEGVTVTLVIGLLGRQIQKRSHTRKLGDSRLGTYVLAGVSGTIGLGAVGTSATALGLIKSRNIPTSDVLGTSTLNIVNGGLVCCGAAFVALAAFIICVVFMQQRNFQQQIRPYRAKPEEQQETGENSLELPSTPNSRRAASEREKTSPATKSSPKNSTSQPVSVRSSFSHVVRPITSKTKLVNKSSFRGSSLDSQRENMTSLDEGFDSWDTSTVDPQSRHAVESASPPRLLETIPASPTGSRSPSPGCALDLKPPKIRRRSRSFSPSTSYTDLQRASRATSPEVILTEGHIHPLFRTDSPTPPPSATPGTIVHAAPGNGLIISDRQSIRSLARMRSGSLPASPLIHQASLDSIRATIKREEEEEEQQTEKGIDIERTLTPPIPDFVMHGTPRNSMQNYARRKVSARGLNKVGEDAEP